MNYNLNVLLNIICSINTLCYVTVIVNRLQLTLNEDFLSQDMLHIVCKLKC